MMKKLNSTGTLWLDNNGYAYSYETQLTNHYRGLRVFNNTFYSMTTRKHQAKFDRKSFDLILNYCSYKTQLQHCEVESAIRTELEILDNQLFELTKKRNTRKKAETILKINNRKNELIAVLNK